MNAPTIDQEDIELSILENIYSSSRSEGTPRQRDLAAIAGASLGMTNAILKRLANKGWIVVSRVNARNVQYAVTPDGMNEIARRSYRYFKRTIKNVVFYRDRIDHEIAEAKRRGLHTVLLVGISDLDFIVEHSCVRHGMTFLKAVDLGVAAAASYGQGVLTVYSEAGTEAAFGDSPGLLLADVLSGKVKGR